MRNLPLAAAVAAAALLSPAFAYAAPDAPVAPALGAACGDDLDGAMTLLPDAVTYAVCAPAAGGYAWAPAPVPFDPNDTWLSYGPPITLHGQGMRNPNLTSGQWTATPRDPQTACSVTQTTVVEAGVLADPQVFSGQTGQPLSVRMLPKLFYAELSGDCLWRKQ